MSYFPENVWVEVYTAPEGLPTWTNIGGSIVTPIKVSTGFSDGGPLARLAPGGDMRFSLRNADSSFDPSTTFYKGQKIRLRVKYGSLVKTKFFGYIDLINLDPGTWGPQLVHVTCIDWLALAAKTPVRAIPGLTNTTVDAAVRILLTQMQIQPEALDFEVGAVTLPYVFNQITPNSTIYSELQNLIMGEWGYIYMRDGGQTLKIENSLSRTGDGSDYKTTSYYENDGISGYFLLEDGTAFLLEDGTNLLLEGITTEEFLLQDGTNFYLEDGTPLLLEGTPTLQSFDSNLGMEYLNIKIDHGDQLTNEISASAIPVVVGGSTLTLYPFSIATGSKALLVPTNSASNPYIIQGQYKDPTAGGAQISGSSIVTPVVATDYTFNSAADGTGTDLSANLTITFTAGASGFKASIVNSGAAGYITKFNVRGIPIYRYSPVETVISDQQSIWDYGDYSLQFTRQYGSTSDDIQPYMFRLLMRDRKPRTIVSDPKFQGFDELDHLAGFLALDIGDQIRLTSAKPVTDDLYYIQGVRFAIQPGSEMITFDYVTTETLAGAPVGVSEIAAEFGGATPSGIEFGTLPVIGSMSQMTIAARIYKTELLFGFILTWSDLSYFAINRSGSNFSLYWRRAYLPGTDGVWETAYSLNASTYYDVLITYDSTSTSNDPVMYLNGSVIAATETSTPAGTLRDMSVFNVGVGARSPLSLASSGFGGKLQNVAVWNRILTAAEITTVYNGGTRLPFASYPQTNLKFFFGGMDTESYTSKLDSTLGVSDTVYDLVNGFAGQPTNSPTLRAVA